ncbi:MAG TPA: ferredoxin--NADP reductase [Blastocatellia bacterium]
MVERRDITADLAIFRFRPDAPFTFQPGQFATLAIEVGDKRIQRAYSIVSSPEEPLLELFIELVPQGKLTPPIWELKTGDSLLMRKRAAGNFTLDEKSQMKCHLMAATVTGIAPFASMIRTHRLKLARGEAEPLRFALVHGASHSREIAIYKDEMEEAARDGWLTYIPTVSRPWEEPLWEGETGRVEDVIRKYADALGFDHTNSVCYACGHPQMIENVKAIMLRARFPKQQFREEKYFQLKD